MSAEKDLIRTQKYRYKLLDIETEFAEIEKELCKKRHEINLDTLEQHTTNMLDAINEAKKILNS